MLSGTACELVLQRFKEPPTPLGASEVLAEGLVDEGEGEGEGEVADEVTGDVDVDEGS